jgi:acyl transferase domain-containing protein
MHTCEADRTSCAGPEGSAGPEGFWAQAAAGADLPAAIPFDRWSLERVYAPDVAVDKTYARFASFIPGVAEFDAAAFR